MPLDKSYLQAEERVKLLFFSLFLHSRPGYNPVILCECNIWFWQWIRTRGNIFAPQRVRLLVWPHFGASTSETGNMSHQRICHLWLQGLYSIWWQVYCLRGKLSKVLNIPLYCLWWPYTRVQGLFGCDYYSVWQSSAHTGPGAELVINHSLID